MLTPNDLPRSALLILEHLTEHGPMAPRDLSRNSKIPLRTVTFALNMLLRQRLLQKVPNLLDMRKQLYHVNHDRVNEIAPDIIRLCAIQDIQVRMF